MINFAYITLKEYIIYNRKYMPSRDLKLWNYVLDNFEDKIKIISLTNELKLDSTVIYKFANIEKIEINLSLNLFNACTTNYVDTDDIISTLEYIINTFDEVLYIYIEDYSYMTDLNHIYHIAEKMYDDYRDDYEMSDADLQYKILLDLNELSSNTIFNECFGRIKTDKECISDKYIILDREFTDMKLSDLGIQGYLDRPEVTKFIKKKVDSDFLENRLIKEAIDKEEEYLENYINNNKNYLSEYDRTILMKILDNNYLCNRMEIVNDSSYLNFALLIRKNKLRASCLCDDYLLIHEDADIQEILDDMQQRGLECFSIELHNCFAILNTNEIYKIATRLFDIYKNTNRVIDSIKWMSNDNNFECKCRGGRIVINNQNAKGDYYFDGVRVNSINDTIEACGDPK